jgi:hypothetical protein
LRIASKAADDEVRMEHAHDFGLDTGSTIILASQKIS